MATLLTRQIATITELREPQKVLDRAGGKPVAILKNSQPVAYIVPIEAIPAPGTHRALTMDEVRAHLSETRDEVQPVLDWLKDK